MTILLIIAAVIGITALLAAILTAIHPAVFYSAWLSALTLLSFRDAWMGRWWWQFATDMALAALTLWSWRKEALDAQDARSQAKA
jgi:membrane protein implicated in regulation of membrane protease activity